MISIVSLFVNDLLWAGNSELAEIIQKLKTILQVGSEINQSFTCVGINLKLNDFSIREDQHVYTESIQLIPVARGQISNTHKNATDKEQSAISTTGQLNWLANTLKPLNSGHLQVLKTLPVIERCQLLGGNLT